MLCLHHDEYTPPTGSLDNQFRSTLSPLCAAECSVPRQAAAWKDLSLLYGCIYSSCSVHADPGVLYTFILVSVPPFRARHDSCILEIEILIVHILVSTLEYWIIEFPLGQTTGVSTRSVRGVVVDMLDGQETGRCCRYLGLPCPLRFHEDRWRPMAVVKRVWGLGLKIDALGGEDGKTH